MLTISTELRVSNIHGLGVFALRDIPAGQTIWRFQLMFDQVWTKQQILSLPVEAQAYLYHYVWKSKKEEDCYLISADNARYFNHSFDANTFWDGDDFHFGGEQVCKARTFIPNRSEITQNYLEFEDSGDSSLWQQIRKNTGIILDNFYRNLYPEDRTGQADHFKINV